MLYENGDLARLTSVCDAEQLYTDAALVLDASTRVAAVSGSGAIDLHFMHKHTQSTFPLSPRTSCFTRTVTLRASRRSVTLSSYTQTQRSCWTHLHAYLHA